MWSHHTKLRNEVKLSKQSLSCDKFDVRMILRIAPSAAMEANRNTSFTVQYWEFSQFD